MSWRGPSDVLAGASTCWPRFAQRMTTRQPPGTDRKPAKIKQQAMAETTAYAFATADASRLTNVNECFGLGPAHVVGTGHERRYVPGSITAWLLTCVVRSKQSRLEKVAKTLGEPAWLFFDFLAFKRGNPDAGLVTVVLAGIGL